MIPQTDDSPQSANSISFSNRAVGSFLIAMGLLILPVAVAPPFRPITFGLSAAYLIFMVIIGLVVGFPDRLPRKMVAFTIIGWGLASMVSGATLLAWIGYNLFIERQPEFHEPTVKNMTGRNDRRWVLAPFAFMAVGYAVLKRGLAGLKR